MKFSAYPAAIALAAASALLLAGCGGGGGSTASNPDSNSTAAIKSSNAKNIGAQAFWALDFLNSQVNASVIAVANATTAAPSNPCTLGGSFTTTGANTDTITQTYTNCDDGIWVSNGTITIKLSNLTGDPFHDSAWKGTLTITFDFRTTFAPYTSSQTGDLVVQYDQTAPHVGTFAATNNSLQARFIAGSLAIERNISKVAYTGAIDSTNLNTFNADFTLSGTFGKLGTASYDVKKTQTDFKRQISTTQNPGKLSQGVMTVTASDNSTLTFTAVDTASARLGLPGWSTTASWDELNTLSNPIYMF